VGHKIRVEVKSSVPARNRSPVTQLVGSHFCENFPGSPQKLLKIIFLFPSIFLFTCPKLHSQIGNTDHSLQVRAVSDRDHTVTRKEQRPTPHAAAHWLTVRNTKALLDLEENGSYNWLIGMRES
jgi:hypothetical protein